MLEPGGPKKPPISENQIQIQLSNKEFSSTSSPLFSSPLFSSPCLSRKDKDKDIEIEEITK
jgi:hypothetical protein